jgi:phosphatidate cytidylyltransferase
MEQSLKNRLTFGPLMLAGLFLLLWLDWRFEVWTRPWKLVDPMKDYGIGGVGLSLLLLFICPIAVAELATLFTAERVRPYRVIAGVGSSCLVLHAFLTQFKLFKNISTSALAFVIVFVMLLAALRRALGKQSQEAIVSMAGTLLATMYLGGLGWFLIALRVKQSDYFEGSTAKMIMILLCVKATDIGAYFGGRLIGRHKLIPWLSPGKTWEGLLCGLLTAGAVGAVCAQFAWEKEIDAGQIAQVPWIKGFIFGAVLGGIGQIGDLFESMMKRDAEVKDSGQLVPGFGGILDIIDSPLFAAPFAYLLFSLY